MNNQNYNGIRSFIAVSKCGSFTLAAEETGLSKAVLSQQLSALEKELEVQLMHRTTRKLRLTELGEVYLAKCQQGFKELELAKDWVTQASTALAGPIKINMVGGVIGEQMLAPLLIQFQQNHPEIELSINFSSHQVDLLASQFDLVIRMGTLADSSLVGRHLINITTRYVAAPEFLNKHQAIQHPQDLNQVPLIYGSVNKWLFKQGKQGNIQEQQVKASKGLQVANGEVMCQAALAGLGVARLADVYVAKYLASGELFEVLPQWQEITPLTLLCPPSQYQLERIRVLMNFLINNIPNRYEQLLQMK
ncbi:MAG: LysR family transcriptional regulator [Thalassotalea sp.]|nr:LysR family transcriptional regulator [Thalassotalea sp.]MDG2392508.1 LysR family transcriptional regulator [Thalassotalea sp.]